MSANERIKEMSVRYNIPAVYIHMLYNTCHGNSQPPSLDMIENIFETIEEEKRKKITNN